MRHRHIPKVGIGDDKDLVRLVPAIAGPVGTVGIGNALHWMEEAPTLRAAAALLRPGGAVVVVTQGPPLWMGRAPWQMKVRLLLEELVGPLSDNCRADQAPLVERVNLAEALALDALVVSWVAEYRVDADWVIGHLGSATKAGLLATNQDVINRLRALDTDDLIESVTTTAIIYRRRHKRRPIGI